MPNPRTTLARASREDAELERIEKQKQDNSPRLTIIKIALVHKDEIDFSFKQAICKKYNIESTVNDDIVFEKYAKNFYRTLDQDEFVVPHLGKKKGISVKKSRAGLVKHEAHIMLTPEEVATKLVYHPTENILEGVMIGGLYGRPRNARQLRNKNNRKEVNKDDVITDDYYCMIYLPMNHNVGYMLLQYYPDITVKNEIIEFIKKPLRNKRDKYDVEFSYYCTKEMSEQFSANSILDHFTFATPFINGDIINGDDEIGEQQVKDVVLKVEVSSPSNQPITYSQIPNFLQRILNMNLNNKAAKDYQHCTGTIKNTKTGNTSTFEIDKDLKIRPIIYLYKEVDVDEDGIPNFVQLKEYCYNKLEIVKSETLPGYRIYETDE